MTLAVPASAADPMPADPKLPTVWIIGDSTVHNGKPELGTIGWGDRVTPYFDTAKCNVVNRARGGRSSRTFITEGLWDDVLKTARPGDVLLMQFGHNDSSPVDDADRSRGSLRGTGDQTQDIYNQVQKKPETVHTFGWYLRKMITEAQTHGMSVVVFSPVPRCPSGRHFVPTTEATGYQEWAKETADATGAAYGDLHARIWKTYAAMTATAIKAVYFTPQDGTHTSETGAGLNAGSVVEVLKALKNDPAAAYLR